MRCGKSTGSRSGLELLSGLSDHARIVAGHWSPGSENMKYTAILLSCAIFPLLTARPVWAQDRGVSSPKSTASAAPNSSASASSRPPASSSRSSALSSPAPRRHSMLSKRRTPPPPPHRIRGRSSSLAARSRSSSAAFGPDPTGRIDQAGKPVGFYPSARSLNTAQHQKSAVVTFPDAKPASKVSGSNPFGN